MGSNICGSPGLKSNVILLHISLALLRSKRSSVKLPLTAASYTLGKLINTYVYTAHMNLTLSGSSELERFERSTAIEIYATNNV